MTLYFLPFFHFLPLVFALLFPSFSAPHIQLRETEVELQRLHNRIAEDRYEGGEGGQWMEKGGREGVGEERNKIKYKTTARFRLSCPPFFSPPLFPPLHSSPPHPPPHPPSHRTREYEERVHALSSELEDVRHRLQAAERQAVEPSPLLLQLQSDMTKMKVQLTQWRRTLTFLVRPLYDLLHWMGLRIRLPTIKKPRWQPVTVGARFYSSLDHSLMY